MKSFRASALALKKVPAANASFTETALRMYKDIDISVAVATPTGLITPIIKHADQKGLAQISSEMKDLAGRAKESGGQMAALRMGYEAYKWALRNRVKPEEDAAVAKLKEIQKAAPKNSAVWFHAADVYQTFAGLEPSLERRKNVYRVIVACMSAFPDTVWHVRKVSTMTRGEPEAIVGRFYGKRT